MTGTQVIVLAIVGNSALQFGLGFMLGYIRRGVRRRP